MAKLTDPGSSERPIPRLVQSQARIADVGSSGAVGQGLERLGRDLEQGNEEIFRAQKIEDDRVNTLRAEEAYTKLREKQLDLTIGDNGFGKLKGSAAVSTPVMPEWSKRFDDASREIEGTLANDEQRRRYKQRAGVTRLQFQEDMLRHLAKEGDVYGREVYEGGLVTERRNAVARWDSPNDIDSSLERVKRLIDERSTALSWPKEYRDAQLQVEQGRIHGDIVRQALASGNYLYAQKWAEDHKGDMDAATQAAVLKAVEDGTQKQLAAGYRADFLANQNSLGGLRELRKRVLEDPSLDDTRRNIQVGQIQARETALEHKYEIARERQLRRVERGIGELNQNTLAGFEPTAEQFAPFVAAARGTELEGEVRQAVQLANATRTFRGMPPVNQERLLAEAEAGVREQPGKFDRKTVAAWRSIYDAQREQVKKSPVTFAVRQGIIDPPQPLDLAAPQQQPEALAERFSIAREMSRRYQAPFKPLTPEEETVLRSSLKGMGPSQKSTYFSRLAQAAGTDYEGYSAVMAQLAPDDPAGALAGQFAYRGLTEASGLILGGQALLRPVRKEDGSPDKGKLWPMPPEAEFRKSFQSYEKDAYAGHPQARSTVYQAAEAIYAKLSADEGDASGVINNTRMDKAIKLSTGGIEKWNGKATVLPYGYGMDQFKDGLQRRIEILTESGRLDPKTKREKLWDLPLEVVGDGRYIFKAGDGLIVDKNNQPVIIDFNVGLPFRTSGGNVPAPSPAAPPARPAAITDLASRKATQR